MSEAHSSVRISVGLRNQLKVIARKLSAQRLNRVTIVGLLEEGIDDLFRLPLEELVQWAKEGRRSSSVSEESIPIRIDSERADKIGLLAATIQEQSNVQLIIVDLTEEPEPRIISHFKQEELNGLTVHDKTREQSPIQQKERLGDAALLENVDYLAT